MVLTEIIAQIPLDMGENQMVLPKILILTNILRKVVIIDLIKMEIPFVAERGGFRRQTGGPLMRQLKILESSCLKCRQLW